MAVPCPGCGREYDVALFPFGRTLHCTCGSRVGVAPRVVESGAPEPRFMVDAMLGRLARWLRLLGLDAAYEAGIADRDLVRLALTEDRVILTRDRRLAREWSVPKVMLVSSGRVSEQLQEVVSTYALDREKRPFSRCSRCNVELAAVDRDEIAAEVPPRVLLAHRRFFRCGVCRRVYWSGSHVARMRRALSSTFGSMAEVGDVGGR